MPAVIVLGCVALAIIASAADLIAGLGITSVAVGFAFRDILQNFFAGILILWRRPFEIGDQMRARFQGRC